MNYKVGFIGAGKMATAIVGGIIKSQLLKKTEIAICDKNQTALDSFSKEGFDVYVNPADIAEKCKYIILAVKPQNIDEILESIKNKVTAENIVVSILAGVSAEYIKKSLGFDCKIVLVMPNTPLLLGYGATAISRIEPTKDDEFEFVFNIFNSAGKTEIIDSNKMREIIPINGSSPAVIYLLAKLFCEKAESYGISKETANNLFCQTLIGSAVMMTQTGKTHQELIDMVCSPGGTTLKMLEALNNNNIKNAVDEAIEACIKRAYELGR